MTDLDTITIEVLAITREGTKQVVEMETSYREGSSVIMRKAIKTRARARALIAVGVVDTVVDQVKAREIQRLTSVRSFEKTNEIGALKEADIVVEVKDGDN